MNNSSASSSNSSTPSSDSNEDLISGLKPLNSSKFRIANQRIFLTYRTHIPKDLIISTFLTISKVKLFEIHIAHESADPGHPYEHTHVYVDFGRNFQTTNSRRFDINDIHPHIKKVLSKKHIYNIYYYLAKEDKSNIDLIAKIPVKTQSLADEVWSKTNKYDALRMANTPSEVSGLSTLYDNKPLTSSMTHFELVRWQKYLTGELSATPHPRHIIWYVDFIGGCSKSLFCKYRAVTYGDAFLTQIGSPTHAATVIDSAIKSGWDRGVVFFDLPRGTKNDKDLYISLEMFKNGFFNTIKYQGKVVIFDNPHIVIFSNFFPDLNTMSRDRWIVRDITPYSGLDYRTMNHTNVPLPVIENHMKMFPHLYTGVRPAHTRESLPIPSYITIPPVQQQSQYSNEPIITNQPHIKPTLTIQHSNFSKPIVKPPVEPQVQHNFKPLVFKPVNITNHNL